MNTVRAHRGFFLLVGLSVVVFSFAYGLSVGLKRPRQWAHARAESWETPLDQSTETALLNELGLPAGTEVSRLGRNAMVNNRPATIDSFLSETAPKRILQEQKQFWEAAGFKTVSTQGQHRGVMVGFDPSSQRKLSLSVWTVPNQLRALVSEGKPVQGMLSVVEAEKIGAAQDGQLIPEVPLIPGGKGGAVFRSDDILGESYSSVYSNPGNIEQNLEFYRRELRSGGWSENGGLVGTAEQQVGHLTFHRESEEIVLLFSPKRGETEETVVAVFRGPQLENQRRVF